MAVAVFAMVVASALALALVLEVHRTAVPAASSVVVLHEQAPDAAERNKALAAQQASAGDPNQTADAKDRNSALNASRS
jgi:hypothetical protein